MKMMKMVLVLIPFVLSSSLVGAQTSVRDSSANTQNDNNKAKNTNNIVGALNMAGSAAAFSACSPYSYGMCILGGILLLMGTQNKKQAGANGQTAGAAGITLGMTDIGSGVGYDPNAVNALNRDPEIAAGNRFGDSMTNGGSVAGATYDAKTNTVKLPDGKVIKGSDVSSPSAMAAAGFSKDVIDGVVARQKEFEAKANAKMDKYGLNKLVVNGEEGGGGGGGGSGSGHSNADASAYAGLGSRGAGLGINRDPAQVAGMQKDFNGEPIGVSGDNLFRMMTRRYKVKESQSSFLDESALLQK